MLYRDKDYDSEAFFVHQALQWYAPGTNAILELGCGTGYHAECLARQGYTLHGIDVNTDMLSMAEQRIKQFLPDVASRLQFSGGDIRNVRLDRQFDAVISLFHVISYQTTDGDLRDAFTTVKTHLKPGGVFVFDFWYGPAVLNEQPAVRVKRLGNDDITVVRIAESALKPNVNVVDVNYTVLITDKRTGTVK